VLGIEVIPASVQDRDCAADLIARTRRLFPFITKIFADGGYAGPKLEADLAAALKQILYFVRPVSSCIKRLQTDLHFISTRMA
jgi:hypothetical protein